jgi:hypothetical protein
MNLKKTLLEGSHTVVGVLELYVKDTAWKKYSWVVFERLLV